MGSITSLPAVINPNLIIIIISSPQVVVLLLRFVREMLRHLLQFDH